VGRAGRHVAALVAAGVGYYAGLIIGVASLGLSGGAEVAPLLTATMSGLAVGLVLGLFDGRAHVGSRTGVGIGVGLLVGLGCWLVEPELEWCVGALALVSQLLAWRSWAGRSGS
jgi:hypothetical protein